MKQVILGQHWRVQFHVIDLTGEEVTPANRMKDPTFIVSVLPAAANRYAAYTTGAQVYCGSDFDAAWDQVLGYVRSAKPDPKLDRYWKGKPCVTTEAEA